MEPRAAGWKTPVVAMMFVLLMLAGSLSVIASGHGASTTPAGNVAGKGVDSALQAKGPLSQDLVAQPQSEHGKILAKGTGLPSTGTGATILAARTNDRATGKAGVGVSPPVDNQTSVGMGTDATQNLATPSSSSPCSYCLWVTPGTPVEIGTQVTWNVNIDTSSMPSDGSLLWTGLPPGCGSPPSSGTYSTPGSTGGTYTAAYSCVPNKMGTYPVHVTTNTKDWAGNYKTPVDSNTVSLAVSPVTLTTQTPTASPTVVDVGSATTFYVSIAWDDVGGFVTFAWNNLPTGCTSSNNPYTNDQGAELLCTPIGSGTFGVTVTSTFQNPSVSYQESVTSNPLPFTVYQDPTVSVAASTSSVDLTQTTSFTATPTYGVGPFSYQWAGLPTGCTSSNSATITCTPTASGGSSVTATATDSSGGQVTSTPLSITVYGDPTVSTPLASPSTVDVGQTVSFSVTANGGSGGDVYAWNLPPGCSSTAASFSCSPTQPGTTAVTVAVTDSDKFTVTSQALSFVVAPPVQTVPASVLVPTTPVSTGSATATVYDPQNGYVYTANENQNTVSVVSGGVVIATIPVGQYPWGIAYDGANGDVYVSNEGSGTLTAISGLGTVATIPVSGGQPAQITYDSANEDLYVGTQTGTVAIFSGITNQLLATVSIPGYLYVNGVVYDSGDGYVYVTETMYLSGGNAVYGDALAVISGQTLLTTVSLNTPSCLLGPVQMVYDPSDNEVYVAGVSEGCPYIPVVSGTSLVTNIRIPGWSGGGCMGLVYDPENSYVYCQTNTGLTDLISQTVMVALSSISTGGGSGGTVNLGTFDSSNGVLYMPGFASGGGELYGLQTYTASSYGGETGETVTFFEGQEGYAGYTYTWSGLPTGCTGANAPMVNCTIQSTASGTFSVAVKVVDKNGGTSTSPTLTFTIYQPPYFTPSLSRTSIDIGQGTTYSATILAGTGQYVYAWTLPGGCTSPPTSGTSGQTVSVTCMPGVAGTDPVKLTVVDSNYQATSHTLSLSVDSDPIVSAPSVSPRATVDSGTNVGFTASPTGGSGGYNYVWTGLPSGCSTANTATIDCTPTTVTGNSTFNVAVTVTDSNGFQVTSGNLVFTLNSLLSIKYVGTSTPMIDGGQSLDLSAQVSGGTGSYIFMWGGLPKGCVDSNSSSLSCTLGRTVVNSTTNISLGLGDSLSSIGQGCDSGCVYASAPLNISATPYVTTPTPSLASVDNGQTVTFSAAASGGTGAYYIRWTGLPSGCNGYDALQITCTPANVTANTTYAVSASLSDTNLDTVTNASLGYTVDADLTAAPVSAPGVLDLGQSVAYTANAQKGSGGYSFAWAGLPNGCPAVNAAAISCTPSAVGNSGPIQLQVRDSNHFLVAPPAITTIVYPKLGAPAFSESRANMDENETIYFNTTETGGTGVYTYTYHGLPPGCISQNLSNLPCVPTASGSFIVNVTVTDTGGGKATSPNVLVNVYKDTLVWVGIYDKWIPPGANPSLNETVANVTGKIWPTVWQSGGDPANPGYLTCLFATGAVAPSLCSNWGSGNNYSFGDWWTTVGTFPVKATVLDSSGWNASFSWNVSVYWPLDMGKISGPATVDSGVGMALNASVVHGAPLISFWWNDTTTSTLLCSGTLAGPAALSCPFTPARVGVHTISLTARTAIVDQYATSDPEVMTENWTLTVNPAFANGTLSARAGTYSASQGGTLNAEVGAAVSLNGTFSGGTSPYTCLYTINGTVIQNVTASHSPCTTVSWSPTTVGAYVVDLKITDGTSRTLSEQISVNVNPTLGVQSERFSPTTPDAGTPVNVSAVISGGLPAYSFSWSFGDGKTQTTSHPWVSHSWTMNGSYTVSLTATDGGGMTKTITAQVHVAADPTMGTMGVLDGPVSDSGVASGDTVQLPNGTVAVFNVTENGGVASYTYVWTLDGVIVGNSTVSVQWSTLHLNVGSDGTYTLSVLVTDSQGQSSRTTITVEVVTDTISSLNLTGISQTVAAGTTGNITVTYGGGFAPFTYHWVVAYPGTTNRTNTTSPWLDIPWNKVGQVSISVTVTDVLGASATAMVNVSVVDTLSSVTLTPSLGVVDAGMWDNLSVTIVGGHAPYTYEWEITAGGKITWLNTTAPWLNRTWNSAGAVSLSVIVADEFGIKVSAASSLTVNQDLAVSCAPTMSGVPMPGNVLTLVLSCVSGGTGALTYDWALGNSSQTTNNGTLRTSFPSGSYQVSVKVIDVLGMWARSQTLVLGTLPPAVTNETYQVLSISESGTAVHLSLEITIQASDADGQIAEYRYALNTTALESATWTTIGQKIVDLNLSTKENIVVLYFQVIDSMGRYSSPYQLPLNVSALLQSNHPTNQNATSGGIGWGEIFLLVVIAVMVAFLIVVTVLQMRRKRGTKGDGNENTGGQSPDDPLQKAIQDHLKENPNETEEDLVRNVVENTGASTDSVFTALSVLSGTRAVTGTEIGDTIRYSARGAEDSQQSIDQLKRVISTILGTVEEQGTVTGSKLQEQLAQYHLSESEITTTLHTLQTEGSVRVDWGDSFGENRIHKMPKTEDLHSSGKNDIVIDEAALFPTMDGIGNGRGIDADRET